MNANLLQLLLPLSLLCITSTSSETGVDQEQDGNNDSNSSTSTTTDETYDYYYQIISCALAAITAWNALVVTLEVNDFRHRLKSAHDNYNYSSNDTTTTMDIISPLSSSQQEQRPQRSSNLTLERYIASLLAIRLGLRDAIVDWSIWYSMGYSIVAGFTWTDADPNTVIVIWGLSVMVAAVIMAICALKVPQWLGFYHKSQLQILEDTSNLAKKAVQDLATTEGGGSTITAFRYQVRLGVGKHFSQFVFFLLPFYVQIKVWFFFLSILVGVVFGQLYMYIVFVCRRRFAQHRKRVTIGASIFFTITSGIIFAYGLATIDLVWNWSIHGSFSFVELATITFFCWTGALMLLQAIQYYEQYHIRKQHALADDNEPVEIDEGEEEEEEGGPILFESSQHFLGDNLQSIFEGDSQQHEQHEKGEGEDVLGTPRLSPGTLQEPLLGGDLSNGHKHSKQSSRYSSGHFDRGIKKEMADIVEGISRDESSHVGFNADVTPNAIYKSLTSPDQVDIKWYHRVWRFLPIKPSWDLIVLGWRSTTSCCNKKSDFKTMSCGHKTWFVLRRTLAIFINLLSIYVAIVCCGATYQIKVTKAKLPYINEVLYEHINEGPVCAFDYKCGTLKTFPNELTSNLANATISHCGACASCSSWNDLELQWSTKDDLSEKAQKCGTKTMFKGIDALQDCLEEDIGWTEPCARCWAEDIVCSKRYCIFIFLQSQMTNQIGNFEVGPETITSATCEEANCEAGNPGDFVACSGSTRRRMNITSDIERPGQQQCAIVGIPNSDWGAFFNPPCPE